MIPIIYKKLEAGRCRKGRGLSEVSVASLLIVGSGVQGLKGSRVQGFRGTGSDFLLPTEKVTSNA
jgi:hypothetical protein